MGILSRLFPKQSNKPQQKVTPINRVIDVSRKQQIEIFIMVNILNWANNKRLSVACPGYLEYGLNVPRTRLKLMHRKLVSDGYLKETDLLGQISALKVDELKDVLRKNGLSTNGKKAVLVARVIDNGIRLAFSDPVYTLSEEGRELVRINYPLIKLLDLDDEDLSLDEFINMWRILSIKTNLPEPPLFSDIAWGIWNRKYNSLCDFQEYASLRSLLIKRFYFLVDESREKLAFADALKICCIDMSGLGDGGSKCGTIMLTKAFVEHLRLHIEWYEDKLVDKSLADLAMVRPLISASRMKTILKDYLYADGVSDFDYLLGKYKKLWKIDYIDVDRLEAKFEAEETTLMKSLRPED